jgi:hypothetical protein
LIPPVRSVNASRTCKPGAVSASLAVETDTPPVLRSVISTV